MKLYMKQKVFSWKSKFYIKDVSGADRYYVEGELFSWGHKLHVFDNNGQEVAFVKQRLMTWMPRYEVYLNGVLSVEVKKEWSFFKPRYTIIGTDWTVNGDFWDHNYAVMSGESQIAGVSKAWFTWGDSYEIDINSDINEVLVLATVLAIDCVLAQQSSSR